MTQTTRRAAWTLADFAAGSYPAHAGRAGDQGSAADFDHEPAAWEKVTNQLLDMWRLEAGWDGDIAPPPPKPLLSSTLKLVAELRRNPNCPAPCRAVATFDGTTVIEWQWPGVLIELEVVGPGRAEGVFHLDGQPTRSMTFGW